MRKTRVDELMGKSRVKSGWSGAERSGMEWRGCSVDSGVYWGGLWHRSSDSLS